MLKSCCAAGPSPNWRSRTSGHSSQKTWLPARSFISLLTKPFIARTSSRSPQTHRADGRMWNHKSLFPSACAVGSLEQIPKEISKWPRRNGLSARKRQRPMSVDLGPVPLTQQTGHCARAASQALLKELLGKGLARRGVSGCVASAGQALWGLACLRALPETPRRCHHFGNLFRDLL